MAVNLRLGVSSGTTGPIERRRSLARRRLIQRSEEPKFEWRENPEVLILSGELPGFKKENLSVYIDLYRNLTVRGERPTEESEVAEESWRPREKPRFRRVFNVPENVDTSSITATFHNEILYVTVPKLNTTSQIRSIEITEQDNRKNDKPASNVADQGIKSDQTPMKDDAEASVIEKKETQIDGKKSQELAKEIADQGIQTDQTPAKDGPEPSVIQKKETQKSEELDKDTEDQGIKSDQTPVKDGAEPSVVKEKETQKSEELGKDTITGSGISKDESEAVKSEQKKTELVKASELDPKSKEKETVENPPEQTKIDRSLPAEESLPSPVVEEKEKSEAVIKEVKEKECGSGVVDEKPKLETHEIKEERLNSDVNESEIATAGKETPIPCIFQSKMWRRRMLVVFAIIVFYVGLYITRRFRSVDD